MPNGTNSRTVSLKAGIELGKNPLSLGILVLTAGGQKQRRLLCLIDLMWN